MSNHHLFRDGATVYDDQGRPRLHVSRFYVGRAKCECGALSDKGISRVAAWAWFGAHRAETARAATPRPLTLVGPMQRCLVHDESFTTVCRGCRSEEIAADGVTA